ncbi:hypothetical protein [Streptomyces sp. NBC_00210]|uniref:hypothetical protein n=1 Tax=Streptomyces sp. NBC_00210 TaxID=2903636 RepID=UPI00386F4F5A
MTLTVHADDGVEVSADPLRLRLVISNLVSNAVRHTGAGDSIVLRGPVATTPQR